MFVCSVCELMCVVVWFAVCVLVCVMVYVLVCDVCGFVCVLLYGWLLCVVVCGCVWF